jgi:hypothetical protein
MGDINVAKLVSEYLSQFHGHYRVPRHFDDEVELLAWLETTGSQYRDWGYYKGHPNDPHCAVHIKDSKWCVLFELRWAHVIIGTIDKHHHLL